MTVPCLRLAVTLPAGLTFTNAIITTQKIRAQNLAFKKLKMRHSSRFEMMQLLAVYYCCWGLLATTATALAFYQPPLRLRRHPNRKAPSPIPVIRFPTSPRPWSNLHSLWWCHHHHTTTTTYTTNTGSILAASIKDDIDVELDDFLADFMQTMENSGGDDIAPSPYLNDNSNDDNYEVASVLDFCQMVEATPVGTLPDEEAKLLREVLTSIKAGVVFENAQDTDGDVNYDNVNDNATPEIAERLLYRMVDEWEAALLLMEDQRQQTKDERMEWLQPTTEDFLTVLQLWETAAIGNKDTYYRHQKHYNRNTGINTNILPTAVERAFGLLKNMQDLYKNAVPSVKPNEAVFATVLRILSASRERGIDRKVRRIFDDMKLKYDIEPTMDMYHSLITALAKSRDAGAANRAESFLREAAQKFPPNAANPKNTPITVDTFNIVLTSWAKSNMHYGTERAEKLIFYMHELDGGQGILRPNASSFTSLLDAYAQKGDWESVSRAERIFNEILDQYLQEGVKEIEPNIATWSIVLRAWGKLSKLNKRAPERADKLMRRLEVLYEDGKTSFGPDIIVYISVLNAWAFSKTIEGPRKAQEILYEMYEKYMDGDDTMKPTAKSICVVIEAWIKSALPDAMENAEKVLDTFEDYLTSMLNDDVSMNKEVSDVYKMMLFGWAKNEDPEQAQNYLMDMIENHMKVDSFCFDRVIEANTKLNDAGAMERSQELFELMEERRQKGLLKPNERVYTSFIRAMTKGRVPNMAYKSQVLLERMKELHRMGDNMEIEPSAFTFNAVLIACAETANTKEDSSQQACMDAFKVAVRTFNELRSLASRHDELQGPDHVSFANMIRCANLLPGGEQKDALVKSTFQLCCKSGLFNSFVLRDLLMVASEDLWRELLHCPTEAEVDLEQLPVSWRRMSLRREQEKRHKQKDRQGCENVRRFRR